MADQYRIDIGRLKVQAHMPAGCTRRRMIEPSYDDCCSCGDRAARRLKDKQRPGRFFSAMTNVASKVRHPTCRSRHSRPPSCVMAMINASMGKLAVTRPGISDRHVVLHAATTTTEGEALTAADMVAQYMQTAMYYGDLPQTKQGMGARRITDIVFPACSVEPMMNATYVTPHDRQQATPHMDGDVCMYECACVMCLNV